jgi:hypothetical protein
MRLRISATDSTEIRYTLLRPEAIVTEDRGSFKSLAKNSTQAALTLPSMGGAVSGSLSASPISPVMAFFLSARMNLNRKRNAGYPVTSVVKPSAVKP